MEGSQRTGVVLAERTHTTPIETDAVIIGAGPVGLFQVFELGLLGIDAHVVDALPFVGGQPAELYPDKPIYDIPAIPVCTGRELIDRLIKQVEPFKPTFHLGHEVTEVQAQADGRFFLATSAGARFITRTLFIAAGVGAFQPRTLKLDGIEAFDGTQLFHRVGAAAQFAGRKVVVVGGGDAALDWASTMATPGPQAAESVTLIHRRDAFQAATEKIDRMRGLCERKQMAFIVGQPTGFGSQGGRLSELHVTTPDGHTTQVPLDALLVLLGLSPRLGPISDWGLAIERKQLVVDTETFATSVPGIFAVGDINTYPGKKKLILSGFHEATLAAFGAARIVSPETKVMLQYTTTSTLLHKRLGVSPAVGD